LKGYPHFFPITSASDNNLLSSLHLILGKMENNTHFSPPPAALHQLKKELPGFIIALTNASGRDQEKVEIKNDR
jgi:hypothetical protein